MKLLLAAAAMCGLAAAAPLHWREGAFAPGPAGAPAGWNVWSAHAANAPRPYVDTLVYRGEPGSLAISGNSGLGGHGGWQRNIPGVTPGAWYRFTAYYKAENVPCESWQVLARLDWRDEGGKRAREPDYVYRATREGSWTKVTADYQAPQKAAGVVVELLLSNAPQGTVWWDEIALDEVDAPASRKVTVVSLNLRPSGTKAAAESVRQFVEASEKLTPPNTDVLLLPEGITVIGTGKTYAEVAEPIPGPTTAKLSELAKKLNTYVVAGIYEREGPVLYNTSVLLDRKGTLVGRYRKVYVPRGEIEGGLTPGTSYPVFRTDFGTVGMMICYDVFFADPARGLATQGAELILMPIWGGDLTLAKARAIENSVYLAASGYDFPTQIYDRNGEIIAKAAGNGSVAVATFDLAASGWKKQLGDMRARRIKELRLDIQPPFPGMEQ
jgi:predicted amidohydrolase